MDRRQREQAKREAATPEAMARAKAAGDKRRAAQKKMIEDVAKAIHDDERLFELPQHRNGRLVFVGPAGESPWKVYAGWEAAATE